MKTIHVLLLLLVAGLFSATAVQSNECIEQAFTSNMTKVDLDEIKERVKPLGIELNYTWTQFDRNGKLTGLAFEAKGFGCEGTARNPEIDDKKRFGFYFDNTPGAKESCGFGWVGKE